MTDKQARTLIVDAAKSYLGFSEASGKHRRIIDIYNEQGKQPLPRGYRVTYSDAWCATFISAIAIQCGRSVQEARRVVRERCLQAHDRRHHLLRLE